MGDTTFTREQFETIYPEGIGNHYWNHARNNIIRKFLVRHRLHTGKILEIGCGRGVVLEYLRSRNIQCTGVELADVEPFSGCRADIFTKTDAFDLPAGIRESQDTVLLLDVIEHLENPAAMLEEIKRKFEGARHIVLTVPARQELWTNYDVYNGHYRRYDLAEMTRLSTAEVRLVEAGYFNHLLYPVFWLVAHMMKKRETSIKAPSGIGLVIHGLLSFVLRMDYSFLPARLPGTSIIALYSLRE